MNAWMIVRSIVRSIDRQSIDNRSTIDRSSIDRSMKIKPTVRVNAVGIDKIESVVVNYKAITELIRVCNVSVR